MDGPVTAYIAKLEQNLGAHNATEHTHRGALVDLLESLNDKVQVVNEPKQRTDCGAPDMVAMSRKGHIPVGHVEAKDIGVSLAEAHKSDQLKRYRKYLPNLILTDYVDFRWYVNGEAWKDASLGVADAAGGRIRTTQAKRDAVAKLLREFLSQTPQPIAKPRDLAERLANITHMVRDIVVEAFARGKASNILRDLRRVLADSLIPELAHEDRTAQFADLYAQTLTYGLFASRCHHSQYGGGTFTLTEAARDIPRTNPLLRQLFNAITGPDFEDEPYASFVRELVAVLDHANIHKVLEDFGRSGSRDPVLHFYETFLATYDPELRERRGVYYTPEPVVSYIVRSVDELLKSRFKIKDGLADTAMIDYLPAGAHGHPDVAKPKSHRTLILDPAAGTGTFLYHVVETIRQRFRGGRRAGLWSDYVHDHLLPRLFGFELLMAPYAMAHLKLGMQLAAQDVPELERELLKYGFDTDDRLESV